MIVNKKHLFIEFVVNNKIYECYFSMNLTLMQNMSLLYDLINDEIKTEFLFDKYIFIYEKKQNVKLNLFIPLKDLSLEDSAHLVVY